MGESKKISTKALAIINVVLLAPAILFWMSIMLYAGLGTDYLFDTFIDKFSQTYWGNLVIIVIVIGFPGVAIVISTMAHAWMKNKVSVWANGIAIALLALGFFAALRRG